MADILDEAYGIVQCKECPWYKACVLPMKFSAEDVRRQMEQNPGMIAGQDDASVQSFISGMATAAQNSLVEGCPVFIDRLRQDPKLAQRIKELMLKWGQEEES